jgi:hypothetical protein
VIDELRKSWIEKLRDSKGLPVVKEITGRMVERWGRGTVVMPAPMEVDEVMRRVPEGKLITIDVIRQVLAERHKATICCPLTTGIFVLIAANAAEEEKLRGVGDTTPYWRTLKSKGIINEKYPGGMEVQRRLLEGEGHQVIRKGGRYMVADYERSLIKMA